MGTIDMRQPFGDDQEVKEPAVGDEVTETPEDASTPESEPEEPVKKDEEPAGEQEPTVTEPESDTEPTVDPAIAALEATRDKLRAEVTQMREERRRERAKPLILEKGEELDLSDVAEQDIAVIEKVLRAKGYVSKSELQTLSYQEKLEASKDEWLQAHPEYQPANDPDDTNWGKLQETLKLFASPSDPKDVKRVLDMAHAYIRPVVAPTKNSAGTASATEKLIIASKGASGGSSTKPAPSAKSSELSKLASEHLKGFTDDELTELLS